MDIHHFTTRVYYEDTDMAGIVYYANYLKFIERARSEWIRSLGIDQGALREDEGLVFVVRKLEADYLAAAKFDDELQVQTRVAAITGARIILNQTVKTTRGVAFEARVTLAMVTTSGHPARLPAEIRLILH